MKFIFVFATLSFATSSFAADLHVKVTNLRNEKGDLAFSVFNNAGYPKKALVLDGKNVTLKIPAKDNAEVVFELPPGEYSVGVIHDKNKNGKFDQLLGKKSPPVEGGSFTRGIDFGGPKKWEDSKITLPPEGANVTLKMRYWL